MKWITVLISEKNANDKKNVTYDEKKSDITKRSTENSINQYLRSWSSDVFMLESNIESKVVKENSFKYDYLFYHNKTTWHEYKDRYSDVYTYLIVIDITLEFKNYKN